MKFLDRLDNVLQWLERGMGWLIAALVAVLVVLVSSQFVDRHFYTLPMAAPDQYARIILVWITFVGFALAVKHGINIRVDLIDARLPPRVRLVLDHLFDLVMLLLTALIGWHGWRVVLIGADQERLGTIFSEAWPAMGLFLPCVMLVLFLLLRIALRFAGRAVTTRHDLAAD